MERISLQGMTDEEKKARKRMQKNEAQKRYYLKNKEYYKERCGGWYKKKCEKLQNKLDKINKIANDSNNFCLDNLAINEIQKILKED